MHENFKKELRNLELTYKCDLGAYVQKYMAKSMEGIQNTDCIIYLLFMNYRLYYILTVHELN